MMFGYGSGWPVWEIVLMWVGMLAFLAVLIWGAYALMPSARRPRQQPHDEMGAQYLPREAESSRILDERLARGEIDAAEYQRLRDLIAAADGHAPAGTGSSG